MQAMVNTNTSGNEQAWRQRMEDLAMQQTDYAKKQYQMTVILFVTKMIVFAVILAAVLLCAPKVMEITRQVSSALENVDGIAQNWEKMASSMEGFSQMGEQSQGLDVETLNKAIGDLQKIVEPLARLFGK